MMRYSLLLAAAFHSTLGLSPLLAPEQPFRAAAISLREAVPPKIFTPNGDGIHDTFALVVDNPAGNLLSKKKIFDIHGNEVADLQVTGEETAHPVRLHWNGRNLNGDLVSSGVYIYQVQSEGVLLSGAVVVAR